MNTSPMRARLNVAGTLEWRDKDGNILKTTTISGSVPLEETGLTLQEAQELITRKEPDNGRDDCQ